MLSESFVDLELEEDFKLAEWPNSADQVYSNRALETPLLR